MKAYLMLLAVLMLCFGDVLAQAYTGSGSSYFCQQEIPDTVFERMLGKSFAEGCTIPREELRYLRVLHYNKDREVLEEFLQQLSLYPYNLLNSFFAGIVQGCLSDRTHGSDRRIRCR